MLDEPRHPRIGIDPVLSRCEILPHGISECIQGLAAPRAVAFQDRGEQFEQHDPTQPVGRGGRHRSELREGGEFRRARQSAGGPRPHEQHPPRTGKVGASDERPNRRLRGLAGFDEKASLLKAMNSQRRPHAADGLVHRQVLNQLFEQGGGDRLFPGSGLPFEERSLLIEDGAVQRSRVLLRAVAHRGCLAAFAAVPVDAVQIGPLEDDRHDVPVFAPKEAHAPFPSKHLPSDVNSTRGGFPSDCQTGRSAALNLLSSGPRLQASLGFAIASRPSGQG
jgi:hypothetical protein